MENPVEVVDTQLYQINSEYDFAIYDCDRKRARTGKRVRFEQKWVFDDGKYFFSEDPYKC